MDFKKEIGISKVPQTGMNDFFLGDLAAFPSLEQLNLELVREPGLTLSDSLTSWIFFKYGPIPASFRV